MLVKNNDISVGIFIPHTNTKKYIEFCLNEFVVQKQMVQDTLIDTI